MRLSCPGRRAKACNFRSGTVTARTMHQPCMPETTKSRRNTTLAELVGGVEGLLTSQELGATTITAGPVTAPSELHTASCFSSKAFQAATSQSQCRSSFPRKPESTLVQPFGCPNPLTW